MDKINVEFAAIDARDDHYTGYRPVGFCRNNRVNTGPKNGALLVFMQREYLTRLRALQEEIRNKYVALFDSSEEPTVEHYCDGMKREEYELAKSMAELQFPGEEALYNT